MLSTSSLDRLLTFLLRNARHSPPTTPRLLWALGVNGEGSSHVTFAFIKHLMISSDSGGECITVVYSARSKLDAHISDFLRKTKHAHIAPGIKLVRLPKFCRSYIIHYILKFYFDPSRFFSSVVVFDDFPFRLSINQVLYFHQPNLVHNNKLTWKIKRVVFKSLLSPTLTVYFQTPHISKAFTLEFGFFKSICFLHSLE
jgi:hypothetical protein